METPANISNLIKRLNIIKALILLEEFDELTNHIQKLKGHTHDKIIQEIITNIDSKFYSDTVAKIEKFIIQNQSLTVYQDPEIEALRIEIKKLEMDVTSSSDEVTEIEKLIHDFGIRHNNELGEIVSEILKLRKEKLESEKDINEKKKEEYEEAKKDYEEYSKQYEETKLEKQFALTDEEKQELKKKYRKATKLCHPDVVTDDLKEYAESVFRDLQKAYETNDLKKVSEILDTLEKGEIFVPKSEGINEKVKLKSELIKLRQKLNDIRQVLSELKESETYQTISEIENWDEYFDNTKEQLREQLLHLADGRK